MNRQTLRDIIGLGSVTGMRSMAGPAILARQHFGSASPLLTVLAAGEMVLDKTPLVGNRIDAVPLAGRALTGAVVGALLARAARANTAGGALLGAAAAVAGAHLAYEMRRRVPLPEPIGGLLEDALVFALASRYAAAHSEGV